MKIISGEHQRQAEKDFCIHLRKKLKTLFYVEIDLWVELWVNLCGRTKIYLQTVLMKTLHPILIVAFKD